MNKGLLCALMLMLALLITGCGVTEVVEERPPVPPDEQEVPLATLTTPEGTVQAGVPGTRCWGGLCVDMVGILAPPEALVVAPDTPLLFELTAGEPTNVNLRVLEWQLAEVMGGGEEAIVDFEAPIVASGDLDATPRIEWYAPSEPGEYALSLFSSYAQGGDISYGWHLTVE